MKTKILIYLALLVSVSVYTVCFLSIKSDIGGKISLSIASLLVAYAFMIYSIGSKVVVPQYDINLDIDMRKFFGYSMSRFVFVLISSIILIDWSCHIPVIIEANGATNIQVILLGLFSFFYLIYVACLILGRDTKRFFRKIPYTSRIWIKRAIILLIIISASYNQKHEQWFLNIVIMSIGVVLVYCIQIKYKQAKHKQPRNPHYADYFKKPSR